MALIGTVGVGPCQVELAEQFFGTGLNAGVGMQVERLNRAFPPKRSMTSTLSLNRKKQVFTGKFAMENFMISCPEPWLAWFRR